MAGVLFLQPKIYRLSMSFVFIEFIVCLPALYVNIGLVFVCFLCVLRLFYFFLFTFKR